MIHLDLFYTLLALFVVSAVVNIFQYVTVCGLQGALDASNDNLQKGISQEDQLRRDLRAAKVEIEQQTNRALRAEMVRGVRLEPRTKAPIDHVHAAVMAGHTGMMAEAMQQHEAQKKHVDEQRRLDSSKHLHTSTDIDSYSHMSASEAWAQRKYDEGAKEVRLQNPLTGDFDVVPNKARKDHHADGSVSLYDNSGNLRIRAPFLNDDSPVIRSEPLKSTACEAAPVDHSPSSGFHSHSTSSHSHQDHASFSCDTGSSSSDSSSSSSFPD